MENIMLDEKKKNVKLIDFGLSNIYKPDNPLRTHCGSPEYAAPELFVVGKTYGPEIDIWSLGIITYAIVLGKLPFFCPFKDEYQRQRMLQQIQKGLSQYNEREMQILSAEARNLLHQILEPNPEVRIPLSEIEIHPWLTKSGKYVFTPYVPPPKDKQLRHQCTSELAIMTGIKRMMVEEQVKEHKADELSAMYNMLVYKKQRERGIYDGDHTCRRAKAPRDSRSKSRDRELATSRHPNTPDSGKGKGLRGKVATTGKKGTGRGAPCKASHRSLASRPKTLETEHHNRNITCLTVPVDTPDNAIDNAIFKLALSPGHNVNVSPLISRHLHQGIHHYHDLSPSHQHSPHLKSAIHEKSRPHDPSSGSRATHHNSKQRPQAAESHITGSSNIPTANVPIATRIPLSQRRIPPAKLNMTLDLSVTTPNTVRCIHNWRVRNAAAMAAIHAQHAACAPACEVACSPHMHDDASCSTGDNTSVTGSCKGVAASSGVRPRISTSPPRDGASCRIPIMSPTRTRDGSKTPCSPGSGTASPSLHNEVFAKKPNRPSTLRYIMTGLEKVRKHLPSVSDSHKSECTSLPAGDNKEGDIDSEMDSNWMRAPKATPEDSVIDSYSSPSPDTENSQSTSRWLHGRLDSIQEDDSQQESSSHILLGDHNFDSQLNDDSFEHTVGQEVTFKDEKKKSHTAQVGQKEHVNASRDYKTILKNTDTLKKSLPKEATVRKTSPKPANLSTKTCGARKDRTGGQYLTLVKKEKLLIDAVRPQLLHNDDPPSYESLANSSRSGLACSDGYPHTESIQDSTDVASSNTQRFQTPSPLTAKAEHSKRMTPLACLLKQTTALTNSGSEPLAVGRLKPDFGHPSHPISLSLSNPSNLDSSFVNCERCGLSPGSPSYDERHVKFCHTGSHALDVFFSPDDEELPSPVDIFWPPNYSFNIPGPIAHDNLMYSQGNTWQLRHPDVLRLSRPVSQQSEKPAKSSGYNFPHVGADTPQIPMQSSIANADAYSQSCPLYLAFFDGSGNDKSPHYKQARASPAISPRWGGGTSLCSQSGPYAGSQMCSLSTSGTPLHRSPCRTRSASPCSLLSSFHSNKDSPPIFCSSTVMHSDTCCTSSPNAQRENNAAIFNRVAAIFEYENTTTSATYESAPDTSLRLEPVGGSCESLVLSGNYGNGELQRVQGDGCTDKHTVSAGGNSVTNENQGETTIEPRRSTSDTSLQISSTSSSVYQANLTLQTKGELKATNDENQQQDNSIKASKLPTAVKILRGFKQHRPPKKDGESTKTVANSEKMPNSQERSEAETERMNTIPQLSKTEMYRSLPSTPEKKAESSKYLRQSYLRTHGTNLRSGISHFLRLRRCNSHNTSRSIHSIENHDNGNQISTDQDSEGISTEVPNTQKQQLAVNNNSPAHKNKYNIISNKDRRNNTKLNGKPPQRSQRCNSIDESYQRKLKSIWTQPDTQEHRKVPKEVTSTSPEIASSEKPIGLWEGTESCTCVQPKETKRTSHARLNSTSLPASGTCLYCHQKKTVTTATKTSTPKKGLDNNVKQQHVHLTGNNVQAALIKSPSSGTEQCY